MNKRYYKPSEHWFPRYQCSLGLINTEIDHRSWYRTLMFCKEILTTVTVSPDFKHTLYESSCGPYTFVSSVKSITLMMSLLSLFYIKHKVSRDSHKWRWTSFLRPFCWPSFIITNIILTKNWKKMERKTGLKDVPCAHWKYYFLV